MRKSKRNQQLQGHRRIIDTLTGPAERRALRWLAARMPVWVSPDLLTAVGFSGAVIIAAGYILAWQSPGFLWLAVAGFGVNWFGDSLDGTLARFRGIERPRYGYFLDHSVDALNELLILFGLGLSPYVRFEIAAIALVGYLLVTLYTSLSTYAAGEFQLSYATIGPTEIRLVAVLASILAIVDGTRFIVRLPVGDFTFYELIVIGLIVLFFGAFILSTARQVAHLAKVERSTGESTPRVVLKKGAAPKPVIAAARPAQEGKIFNR